MSCLYILDISPLLVISFANIFSHLVGCHFILSMVSLAVQKFLSLIRSRLFIFAFISFALGACVCVYAKPLQSCLTLCDAMDSNLPVCSVHGILQAIILEWDAMPLPVGFS